MNCSDQLVNARDRVDEDNLKTMKEDSLSVFWLENCFMVEVFTIGLNGGVMLFELLLVT